MTLVKGQLYIKPNVHEYRDSVAYHRRTGLLPRIPQRRPHILGFGEWTSSGLGK